MTGHTESKGHSRTETEHERDLVSKIHHRRRLLTRDAIGSAAIACTPHTAAAPNGAGRPGLTTLWLKVHVPQRSYQTCRTYYMFVVHACADNFDLHDHPGW